MYTGFQEMPSRVCESSPQNTLGHISYRIAQFLAEENIGKFGKQYKNRQNIPRQTASHPLETARHPPNLKFCPTKKLRYMVYQNTLAIKNVRGQSEAAL